jgi:anti-sigma B factor antagonist
MKVSTNIFDNVVVLEVDGVVDAEHCSQLKKAIEKARGDGVKHFVLDLHKVGFIDSTGLGILISLMRQQRERDAELRLTGLQDEVRAIFEITRLFRVFDIAPSVQAAVDALRRRTK